MARFKSAARRSKYAVATSPISDNCSARRSSSRATRSERAALVPRRSRPQRSSSQLRSAVALYVSNVNDPSVPNTCSLRPACPFAESSGRSAPRVARYWARNSSITASAVRTSRFSRRLVSTSCRSTESWIRSSHCSAGPESRRNPGDVVSYANGTRAVSVPGGSSVSRPVRSES